LISLYYHAHSGVSLLEQRLEKHALSLTPREAEILTWIARGKSSWEVSQILSVSERTVLFHIDNAKKKMGVSSRTHLVVKAAMEGLIQP
jgi:DNA-binding CsgD family transcriptional regulator